MHLHKGFTLLELIISVAVIGTLSSYAIPAYDEYAMRSKLIEAVAMSKDCQLTITEAVMMGESHETNQWGCESNALGDPNEQVSKYVRSIQVDNHGVITVTLHNFKRRDMDGRVINFAPLGPKGFVLTADNVSEEGPVVGFDCRTASAVNGVPARYLPPMCHGV